ncbi:MAG: ABC transporter ATP-binding protein [Desulfobacterales bacterium]|jgi:putative spermidine/putrescine transport system ATP-binding protein
MSIQFQDVTFTYPNTVSGVFNLSLTVASGELMAVIGASGSGKSTLLKLIAGIESPRSGKIFLDENDITPLPVRKRKLGIVFQSYALFPHMTVIENVAYPLKVRKISVEKRRTMAKAALERVGLDELGQRYPKTLSGGQQQRVALARALVFQPRALLLDEPLSALDAGLRGEMRDEILRLQREQGITTIHITHDQEEALSMADRVTVMEAGRLLQIATPEELYDHPATRSIAAFVGRSNLWEATISDSSTVVLPFSNLKTSPHSYEPGSRVTVLIRPENVMLGPSPSGINTFRGPIRRDRFLGAVRQFDMTVGRQMLIGTTDQRGEIHTVHIPPEKIQFIPAIGKDSQYP